MDIDFSKVDWVEKLVAAGIDAERLQKKAGPCPLCYFGENGGRRFRFDNKGGMGTWYCQQCGAGNGYTLLLRYTGQSPAEILKELSGGVMANAVTSGARKRFSFEDTDFSPEQVRKNRQKLAEVTRECKKLNGEDTVSRYLHSRVPGLDREKISADIMWHRALKFYEEKKGEDGYIYRGKFQAMVARARSGDGTPITLHRTYLTPDGRKAPFENVKKQMKGIRKLGGAAIRLVEVPGSRVLGVTEGIETGLAVATGYRYRINVWSMLNCVNLGLADIPLDDFDEIIIFADHDRIDAKNNFRPGEHHARILMKRLSEAGKKVTLKLPKEEGTDFADVWIAVQGEKVEGNDQTVEQVSPRPVQPSASCYEALAR